MSLSSPEQRYAERIEAQYQYQQDRQKLWQQIRNWEAKRRQELEQAEHYESNQNWGTFT